MGNVQLVAIGPFEAVCGVKYAVVVGKVFYIVTHQGEKWKNNEY